MTFNPQFIAQSHFKAWHTIATQQAAKLVNMLPTDKLSGIPFGGHLVSVIKDTSNANGLILFGSTFFSDVVIHRLKSFGAVQSFFKDDKSNDRVYAPIVIKMVAGALTAGVVRVAVNYASSRTFSTAAVVPTMLVAAVSPITSKAFDKLHTKISEGANKFFG